MSTEKRESGNVKRWRGGTRWYRSLRTRLLVTVNLVVSLMVVGALSLDYQNQLTTELTAYRAVLGEEARALIPGILELQHHGIDTVQRYIDAVCVTMQDGASPGHHIVVEFDDLTIQAQSHHRASDTILARIRDAAESIDGQTQTPGKPLVVGSARQGALSVYVSEESEPVVSRIRRQAIIRLLTLAGIGVAGTVLVNIVLVHQVTKPVQELVDVVQHIGAGDLGTQPQRFATQELDLLASEIGRMSMDLQLRELDRAAHLDKARRIQKHLLPSFTPDDDISVAVVYRPADTVAGDYYDVLTLSDGSILICLADVCGHGVPAAMGAAVLKTLLLSACEQTTSLTSILHYINERFIRVSLPEDFASMVLLRVEPNSGLVEFANAGHEPAFFLHGSEQIEELSSTGMVLGVSEDVSWMIHQRVMSSQDRIVLITDGVSDTMSPDGQHYGRQTVSDLLTKLGKMQVAEIANEVITSLDSHRAGEPIRDDQTIFVLQFSPTPAAMHNMASSKSIQPGGFSQ